MKVYEVDFGEDAGAEIYRALVDIGGPKASIGHIGGSYRFIRILTDDVETRESVLAHVDFFAFIHSWNVKYENERSVSS